MSATVVTTMTRPEVTLMLAKREAEREQTVAKLEQMCLELGEVRTLQGAKHYHDLAKAAGVYASQHKLGREIVMKARAIAWEAQRRFGQIWQDAEKNVGT